VFIGPPTADYFKEVEITLAEGDTARLELNPYTNSKPGLPRFLPSDAAYVSLPLTLAHVDLPKVRISLLS
jgi:hypothetical protein